MLGNKSIEKDASQSDSRGITNKAIKKQKSMLANQTEKKFGQTTERDGSH